MKRIIFILIILIVITYFQYYNINNINNSYEILQYENPKKNMFEVVLKDKLISVFTSIKFNNWNETSSSNHIEKLINKNLYYYNIPLCIEASHKIVINSKYKTNIIQKQNSYRRLFYILKGTMRFFIFNSMQNKYLYLKNNVSPINLWNQDTEKYPLINKAKYIEIICRKDTMIYIPYNFYYTWICDEDSICIDLKSESIFSKLLKN